MGNDVREFPVPLIFKKIYKSSLSGKLQITGEGFTKNLYFVDGQLYFASSTITEERMTQLLLKKGKINQEVLDTLDAIISKSDNVKKVGEILTRISTLNNEDIHFALLYQVKVIAVNAFPQSAGEWVFYRATPKIPSSHRLRVEMPIVIKEGVETMEDFSFYRQKFLNCSPVTTSLSDEVRKHLTAEELDIYLILTNETEATVGQIIGDLKYNETIMWKKITTFYLLNILAFSTLNPVYKGLNEIRSEINDLYNEIQTDNLDYYQLLGLPGDAVAKDIENRYLQMISAYHPDKLSLVPNSEFEERVNRVVSEINAAYKVLSDEKARAGYHQKTKSQKKVEEQQELLREKKQAKGMYQKAKALYQEQKYNESIYHLLRAVALDQTKASYYLLLGLCQSKYTSQRRKAVENLLRAAEMEPWNADPYFAIGNVFRSEKLLKKARYYFEKALEINMDHTLASQSLQEITGRKRSGNPLSIFKKKP